MTTMFPSDTYSSRLVAQGFLDSSDWLSTLLQIELIFKLPKVFGGLKRKNATICYCIHRVIFLGEMQTKFYCQNIGIIVIFDKKMFKFLCHMIGSNHY